MIVHSFMNIPVLFMLYAKPAFIIISTALPFWIKYKIYNTTSSTSELNMCSKEKNFSIRDYLSNFLTCKWDLQWDLKTILPYTSIVKLRTNQFYLCSLSTPATDFNGRLDIKQSILPTICFIPVCKDSSIFAIWHTQLGSHCIRFYGWLSGKHRFYSW